MGLKENKNNLFLLTIVAIVAIVAIVIMIATTGSRTYNAAEDYVGQAAKATASAEMTTEGKPASDATATKAIPTKIWCKDSDGGKNYNVKGELTTNDPAPSARMVDYCRNFNSSTLVEYYCERNKPASEDHMCPYGCENGACKNQTYPMCGNGIVEPGETCDGSNLAGFACEDFGYAGGQLSCYPPGSQNECTFDTTQCIINITEICGDGVANGYEQCDGNDLGMITCTDINNFVGGILSCTEDCTFDTSNCDHGYGYCGDNAINNYFNEQCDGTDWGNINSCTDFGFTGGTLTCNSYNSSYNESERCKFNTNQCTSPAGFGTCGDMVLNKGEQCELNRPITLGCTDFDSFIGGSISCNYNTCQYDLSGCITGNMTGYCGDGMIQAGEECDDGNSNNADMCNNDCILTSCGDGIVQWPNGLRTKGVYYNGGWGYEQCDDANTNNNDGCTTNCTITQPTCTDTDGGINYYTFGTVTWTNGSYSYNYTDYCSGNTTLYERYCSGNYYATSAYACPYQCSGGRCVNQTNITNLKVTGAVLRYYADNFPIVNGSLYAGDEVLPNVKINNTGNSAINMNTFSIRIVNLNSGKSETHKCHTYVTWLQPGQVKECQHWDNGTYIMSAGYNTFTYEIDVYNQIPESNENDNFYNYTVIALPNGTGNVYVYSTPTSANVYIDTVYKGVTPINIPGISAGRHNILVSKPGVPSNFQTTRYVFAGQTIYVNATFG